MQSLPIHTTRELNFSNGAALGISNRWEGGQYCCILTAAGIVGCGTYDLAVAEHFSQAIAVARGTPENPLVDPEDLLPARIADCTSKARSYGIEPGMTGLQAVERMLAAAARS